MNSTGGPPASGPRGNSTGGPPGGPPGAGGPPGGKMGGDSARALMFAQRHAANVKNLEYYAAALCGIMALFIFLHWTRLVMTKAKPTPTPLTRPFVMVSRSIRNVLVRGAPGFNSAGHGLLVALYVAINLAIIFTNVNQTDGGHMASRFGWVLLSNVCFTVFLALKNTPLAFLSSYSYERLNNLHQISGCTTFLLMCIHGLTYTGFFAAKGQLRILRQPEQIAGIVAAFALLFTASSAMLIRRFAYETFYAMHVLSFIASIIAIGFHRPDFHEQMPIITCIAGGMWAGDRLIRLTRFVLYSINNEATVYPLPNGGTRIIMAKKPAFAVPGKHCFVWIPKIRKFETHPFTIIATKPMEFVVKEYNGFTRDLHAYATANPGGKLKASMEGPYGTFPDPMAYDKIILIAGGSGASYTIGLAVNMLERMDASAAKSIVFIWTAQTHENLSWFTEHLNTLRTHSNSPKVHVSLYVTRSPSSTSSLEDHTATGPTTPPRRLSHSSAGGSPTSPTLDLEKPMVEHDTTTASAKDPEKPAVSHTDQKHHVDDAPSEHSRSPLRHAVASGRPDTATLVRAAISATGATQRVLVAACGPPGLMKTVRNATAERIRGDGPGVELHCEQFGW